MVKSYEKKKKLKLCQRYSHLIPEPKVKPMSVICLSRLFFYLILSYFFVFSTLFAILLRNDFSPFWGCLFLFPYFCSYVSRLKINKGFIILFAGIFLSVLSGVLNGSNLFEIILYLRYFLVYFLVYSFLHYNKHYIPKISTLLFFYFILQLLVVLTQKRFPQEIIELLSFTYVHPIDVIFGTFYIKNDVALNYFIISYMLYIVYYSKTKWKLIYILIAIIIVLMSNCKLGQILFIVCLFIYMLSIRNRYKNHIYFITCILVLVVSFLLNHEYFSNKWKAGINDVISPSSKVSEQFLKGETYSKGATIFYIVSKPISIFGDGPGSYYSSTDKKKKIGISGQLFKNYLESGIISVGIFYIFLVYNYNINRKKFKFGYQLSHLLCISSFMITKDVFNDPSMIMIYVLFTTNYLIVMKTEAIPEKIQTSSKSYLA